VRSDLLLTCEWPIDKVHLYVVRMDLDVDPGQVLTVITQVWNTNANHEPVVTYVTVPENWPEERTFTLAVPIPYDRLTIVPPQGTLLIKMLGLEQYADIDQTGDSDGDGPGEVEGAQGNQTESAGDRAVERSDQSQGSPQARQEEGQ
jgi:hypothetical protein